MALSILSQKQAEGSLGFASLSMIKPSNEQENNLSPSEDHDRSTIACVAASHVAIADRGLAVHHTLNVVSWPPTAHTPDGILGEFGSFVDAI